MGGREGGREDRSTSLKPSWSWMRAEGWWSRVPGGVVEGRCLAQPAPRRPLLAGLQPRPEGVSELGQWVVPRLRLLKPRAQGRGRAGQGPAHRLGPAVAGSVIPHPSPPPSPLMTVCVCPVGTRPSEGLWARSGKPYPRPLQPCLLVLSPPARCLLGIGSLRGGGGRGRGSGRASL